MLPSHSNKVVFSMSGDSEEEDSLLESQPPKPRGVLKPPKAQTLPANTNRAPTHIRSFSDSAPPTPDEKPPYSPSPSSTAVVSPVSWVRRGSIRLRNKILSSVRKRKGRKRANSDASALYSHSPAFPRSHSGSSSPLINCAMISPNSICSPTSLFAPSESLCSEPCYGSDVLDRCPSRVSQKSCQSVTSRRGKSDVFGHALSPIASRDSLDHRSRDAILENIYTKQFNRSRNSSTGDTCDEMAPSSIHKEHSHDIRTRGSISGKPCVDIKSRDLAKAEYARCELKIIESHERLQAEEGGTPSEETSPPLHYPTHKFSSQISTDYGHSSICARMDNTYTCASVGTTDSVCTSSHSGGTPTVGACVPKLLGSPSPRRPVELLPTIQSQSSLHSVPSRVSIQSCQVM